MSTEAPVPRQDPQLAVVRTLVRHERGTLLVLNVVLMGVLIAQSWTLVSLWSHTQLYSTPDIYREQRVDVMWGSHGK